MNSEWTEDFFRGLALELWRKAIPPEQTLAEVGFLEAQMALPPGARLLDVPCGNGRLALELAGRGYAVTGVDACAEFIAEARRAAGARGVTVDWRQGDMRALDWAQGYDGVFCFGNSFGYFDAEGTGEFLQGLADALKPGGRLVLDTDMAAESLLPLMEERIWTPVGEMTMLADNSYDVAEGRLDTEYTFIRGAERQTATAHYWVFTVGEIRRMLGHCGLETLALYGGPDGEPFAFASPRLLLVAEKRK